jgi:4-amino-4-deoxy-L-arabinose transferase-like glycosyltransferase
MLRRAPLGIAVGLVGLLLAIAPRYGWHRDELYFLQCGKRLAWGYVDQPPFTPFIARIANELFGTNLVGLRLFPALAAAAVVLLMAAMAKELGGGPLAATIAAAAGAVCPLFLGMEHLLSTATFDLLAWTAITFLVVRLLRRDEERLWLAVGATAGLGLLNKHTVVFLMFGIVVGLALTPSGRRHFGRPWLWAGGALALLIWLPNLVWQAQHDWAVVDMLRSLNEEPALEDLFLFVPSQLVILGALAFVWIRGLRRLLRDELLRVLGVAYLVLLVLFLVARGKPYYLAGLYPVLLAAGAVAWEDRERRAALPWIIGATFVLGLPLALPVIPIEAAKDHPIEDLQLELGAQLGWPALVDRVADVREVVDGPVTVLTANYGQAGAIELYGPSRNLPQPYSGHNNEWLWGPPPRETPVTITVGFSDERLRPLFGDCERVGVLEAPHGVASEEDGTQLHLCQDQRAPWPELWPALRHYSA